MKKITENRQKWLYYNGQPAGREDALKSLVAGVEKEVGKGNYEVREYQAYGKIHYGIFVKPSKKFWLNL